MARGYTTRKLEVWSLHAHTDDGAVGSYESLFRAIAGIEPAGRSWETNDKVVAIPTMEVAGATVRLTAFEGPRGQPIIYDVEAAQERVQALDPAEIVATKTHVLVNLDRREAIVEYNHRGAKAQDIAAVLGRSARRLSEWSSAYVELAPKVDRKFVEAIDTFERVRIAGLRVTRPNQDWTDWDDHLAHAASESGAQSAQSEFIAPRGMSLSKTGGAVPFIKKRVSAGIATLKNAWITGVRTGERAETTITMANYKEHQRVNVRKNEDGHVDEADIARHLEAYEASRRTDASADGSAQDGG